MPSIKWYQRSIKLNEWSSQTAGNGFPRLTYDLLGLTEATPPTMSDDLPSAKAAESLLKPTGVISLGANTGRKAPANTFFFTLARRVEL